MAQSETIGFIGVGLMGAGIAANLLKGGYQVAVLANRNRAPIDDLLTRGATEVANLDDLAAASSAIFLCLPNSDVIEGVLTGANGLLGKMKSGSVIIDCSTANPVSTMAMAAQAQTLGIDFVDAPLGRTPKEAWAGELDAMVGASETVFARVRPMIDCWAGKIVHIGDVGAGHKMKLINNFLSMGYGALYAEALTLAKSVGLEPEVFDSVIRGGRMDSGFYQTFMNYTLNGDQNAHKFTLTNALKDMRYCEAMAQANGIANPVGNAVKNSYSLAVSTGGNGPDDHVPMLPERIARLNGVDLSPRKSS